MARAVGYMLILAGVGMASTLLPLGSDADPALRVPDVLGRWLDDDVRIVTIAPAETPAAGAGFPAAARTSPLLAPQPAPSTPIVVTLPPRSESSPMVQQAVVGPGSDPAALARELQRELKRVGCYGGDLNGVWTLASRRAMKTFTDRVNAALPVDAPDPILLSLVRAHQGDACGKPCPAHEKLAEDGRCVPTAVLAHSNRKGVPPDEATAKAKEPPVRPAPVISSWTTTVATLPPPAAAAPAPPGRMALAGPQPEPPPAAAGEAARAPSANARTGKAKPPRAARVRKEEQRMAQRSYSSSRSVETFFRNLVLY